MLLLYIVTYTVHRVSWFTAGTRDPATTGEIKQVKFSWSDGDQSEVTGAQFWFYDTVRQLPGNRIVYYTDGIVTFIIIIIIILIPSVV